MTSLYEQLSSERKSLQEQGLAPAFFTTGGWQLFKDKYLFEAADPKEQYQRIAKTLAKHAPTVPDWWPEGKTWEQAFFDDIWNGNTSLATPVLANTGTKRGLPVSCSGNVIGNDIFDIYDARKEVAVLTKNSFGTASYLGKIAPRGSISNKGVKCSGVMPIIEGFVDDMRYVAQGSSRRGAWAGYLPINHGDFEEVVTYLKANPDDLNLGWVVFKDDKVKMDIADPTMTERYQTAMSTKMETGKGYWFFHWKAQEQRPQMYKDRDLEVVAPQLCNEIMLHSSEEYTYTCVLSSKNLAKWDEWKDTESVFISTVMLDCVVSEFLEQAKGLKGLEKAVAFTEAGRALGLGACGFHTYLQAHGMPMDSMETYLWNIEAFKHIADESLRASQWMAKEWGEPEWCKGYGVRNTHRTAIAPTKSTALIMGGVSEGINPDPAMTYTQLTPAGEVDRANPVLLQIMKDRNVYDAVHFDELIESQGSVQNVTWLSDEEKQVFRTAFEIDQHVLLRLASARQKFTCQGQSLNLWFAGDEEEEYISEVHQAAFDDPNILGLYYCYSKAGVLASRGECASCQ